MAGAQIANGEGKADHTRLVSLYQVLYSAIQAHAKDATTDVP